MRLAWLQSLFAYVCGQNPDHTCSFAGLSLPFCERCTGLYVGAFFAFLLHLLLCPAMKGRFLSAHGAFLLVMAPFGFHWIEHGAVLRVGTGLLFGFGTVTFLLLPFQRRGCEPGSMVYFFALALLLLFLPLVTLSQAGWAGLALCLFGSLGLLALLLLVLANVARFGRQLVRHISLLRVRPLQPHE